MHDPLTQGQLWIKLHDRSSTSCALRASSSVLPLGTMSSPRIPSSSFLGGGRASRWRRREEGSPPGAGGRRSAPCPGVQGAAALCLAARARRRTTRPVATVGAPTPPGRPTDVAAVDYPVS